MGKRVSIRHKRRAAPEWVFRWRRLGDSPFPMGIAVLVVGGVFAFFLSSVRIQVSPPAPWATRKASMIQVADDAESRALTLRAMEGGPFPSRFEPAEWERSGTTEQLALQDFCWTPPPYEPTLQALPDHAAPALSLAPKGEPVLPKRVASPEMTPLAANLTPEPMLFPLSGITAAEMPKEIPPFAGAVDAAMTADSWQFLVRLDPSGSVRECVPLAGGNEAGPPVMAGWLRKVTFAPAAGNTERWIAVGVGFTNQPANGTHSR